MKTIYYDVQKHNKCIGVLSTSAKVMPAGTDICAMPLKLKNDEYIRYAEEYDIHFIFEDNIPEIDFYTIPLVDIMAIDSSGGFIATIGQRTDPEGDAPICYIKNKECFLIANSGPEFLANACNWKSSLKPYQNVAFYSSVAEAKKQAEFIDIDEIHRN